MRDANLYIARVLSFDAESKDTFVVIPQLQGQAPLNARAYINRPEDLPNVQDVAPGDRVLVFFDGGDLASQAYWMVVAPVVDPGTPGEVVLDAHLAAADPHGQYVLESTLPTTLSTALSDYYTKAEADATFIDALDLSGEFYTSTQVDNLISNYLLRAGGTMTGYITLHASPTSNMHPATKVYTDNAVSIERDERIAADVLIDAAKVNRAGDTMTGDLVAPRFGVPDSDSSHRLFLRTSSNLTANREMIFATGDATRTLTMSGNAALNQNVRSTDSPTFAQVTASTAAPVSAGHLTRKDYVDAAIAGISINFQDLQDQIDAEEDARIAADAVLDSLIDNHIAAVSAAHAASAISFASTPALTSTTVQDAIVEVLSDAAASAAVAIAEHEAKVDPHPQYLLVAEGDVRYVNVDSDTMTGPLTLSGPPTVDLHAATKGYVDSVGGSVEAHLDDPTDAHAATAISFTPTGGIAATTAQAAIVEALTDAKAYTDIEIIDHKAESDPHPQYLTEAEGDSRYVGGGGGTISGNLSISGNLTVNGTSTTVNSTTVTLDDPILTLGGDSVPTLNDGKDRGIEFRYYDTAARLGFMGWDRSQNKYVLLTNASNTSEVFTGTKAELDANVHWSNLLGKPNPTITLGGDLTGSLTMTDLAGGTLTATIAANSVALGTDTTGNYIATIAGTANRITVSGSGGEGGAVTLNLPQDIHTAATPTFSRLTISQATGVAPFTVSSTTAVTNLNADLLDGQHGSYYLDWANVTNKPDPVITLAGDTTGSVTLTDLGSGTLTVTVLDDSHAHDTRYYTESEMDVQQEAQRVAWELYADNAAQGLLDSHLDDATGAHAASAISFTPPAVPPLNLFLTSTNLQGAVSQVAAEIDGRIEAGDVDAIIDAINNWNTGDPTISNSDVFESEVIVTRALAAGAVVASTIAAGVINTSHMTAGTIDADRLDAETTITVGSDIGYIELVGTDTDSTTLIRSSGVTSYNSGTGFYMDATGRMFLGNSAGNKLTFNGADLTIVGGGTFSGDLDAAGGTFEGDLTVGTGSYKFLVRGGATTAIGITDQTSPVYNNAYTSLYADSTGKFSLKQKLVFDGTNLTIDGGGTFSGNLSAAGGTFAGSLSAATGTFAGSLSAATGTFAGSLSAATGTFSGALSAATGTFSGDVSGASGTFTGDMKVGTGTNRFKIVGAATTKVGITSDAGALTYNNTGTPFYADSDGKFSLKQKLVFDGTNLTIVGGGTFSGALSAATGTFAGSLSAATGTFAGSLSAATGTFAGSLSAATGTFAGSLSAATGTFAGTVTAGAVESADYAYPGTGDFSTAGIRIDLGLAPYIRSKFFAIRADGSAYFKGDISGATGVFSGSLEGASISGGTIDIGGADATSWHVDVNGNMWLGAATFATAPFRVSNAGVMDVGGTDATSFHVDATGNIWAGNALFGSAPFRVSNAGALTASNVAITGGTLDVGGADATSFHVDASGNIWLGAATFASAPFKVSSAGQVTATTGTFSGSITGASGTFSGALSSTTGSIGGWEITPSALSKGTTVLTGSGANGTIATSNLTATGGTIGGWLLGPSQLSSGGMVLADTGNLTAGTGNDVVRLSASDATYRLWVGNSTASAAAFSVQKDGSLTSSKATITGGSFAVGVDANSFHVDVDGNMWLGAMTYAAAPFKVNNAGQVTATSGNFSGTLVGASITGTSGTFTGTLSGATISGGTIDIGGADATSFHVDAAGRMWVGAALFDDAPFKVQNTGEVTATTGTFSGSLSGADISGATGTFEGLVSGGSIDIGADVTNRFHVDASGQLWLGNLSFTTAKFKVGNDGTLTAKQGTIGGWTLGEATLTGADMELTNTGNLRAGTSDSIVRISADDVSYRMWAGHADHANAPFKVSVSGALTATSATISGTITSSNATIAGGTISSSTYSWTSPSIYSTSGLQIGMGTTGYIRAKNFAIDSSGNAYLKGTVEASGGTIGLLNVGSVTGGQGTKGMYVGTGAWNSSATPFYIDNAGDFSLGSKLRYDASLSTLFVEGDAIIDGTLTLTKLSVSPSSDSIVPNGDMMGSAEGTWFAYEGYAAGLSIVAVPDGPAGGRALQHVGGNSNTRISSRKFPVTGGGVYAFGMWVKSDDADTASTIYLRFVAHDAAGAAAYASTPYVSRSVAAFPSVEFSSMTSYPAAWGNNSVSNQDQADITSWTYIEGITTMPAGAVEASFQMLNWTSSDSTLHLQGLWVRKQSGAVTISDGTITTEKFDTNAIKSLSPAYAYTSGPFSTAGSKFDLANGNIITPSFSVIDGVATFNGGGTFSGALSAATGTFTGDMTVGTGTSRFKVVGGSTTAVGITTTAGTLTYNNTGTPVYMDSTGKFSLKQKLVFDGTNLSLNGSVTAASGNIAGWSINSSSITKGNTVLSASGTDGSISAAAFYLKDGAATRGSWVTNQSIPAYGTLDGIEASLQAGSTRSFLGWRSGAGDYKIGLITNWSGGGETHAIETTYYRSRMASYDQLNVSNWTWVDTSKTSVGIGTQGNDRFRAVIGGDTTISSPGAWIVFPNHTKMSVPDWGGTGYNLVIDAITGVVEASFSKRELKEEIKPLDGAFAGRIIDALTPVSFIWKPRNPDHVTPESEEWRKKDIQYGFIADEVADVDPHLAIWSLKKDAEGDLTDELEPGSWSAEKVIALLVLEVQGLRSRVASLEAPV